MDGSSNNSQKERAVDKNKEEIKVRITHAILPYCVYCESYVSSPHHCPQSVSVKPDMEPYDQSRLGQVYAASNLHPNFTRRSGKFGD